MLYNSEQDRHESVSWEQNLQFCGGYRCTKKSIAVWADESFDVRKQGAMVSS